MRPVPIRELRSKITAAWQKKAKQAEDDAASAPAGQRSKVINGHSDVWGDLKETLRDLSNEKCWYCESIDIRSDNAVDHFRPKNHVKEAPDPENEGYWWLAFDWENYRFCCTFCNSARKTASTSGGKQDRFPLADETRRAKKKGDPLLAETPVLLDPVKRGDCMLLTFDGEGQPVSARSKESDPVAWDRVNRSVDIYHLDQPKIVQRRMKLFQDVLERLTAAQELWKANNRQAYDLVVDEIAEMMDPKSQYSMTARAAVESRRGSSPMVDELLRL